MALLSMVGVPATEPFAKRPSARIPNQVAAKGAVDRVHRELRHMAITFGFFPGERLNEAILATKLGVSRTPLRQALNRLCVEGFLTFSAGQGFFRKPLEVKEIFDLYELRQQIETAAVRLAVERATDEQLLELERFAQKTAENNASRTLDQVNALDEEFHERLIALTGNIEMRDRLRNVNDRVRYVRCIDTDSRRSEIQIQHQEIVRALRERNTEKSVRLMGEHIGNRPDQITEKVERCYGRIYVSAQGKNERNGRREMMRH